MMVWRGVASDGVVSRGVAWRGMAWRGVSGSGMAWRGVVQFSYVYDFIVLKGLMFETPFRNSMT